MKSKILIFSLFAIGAVVVAGFVFRDDTQAVGAITPSLQRPASNSAAASVAFLPIPDPLPVNGQATKEPAQQSPNAGDKIKFLSKSNDPADRFQAYMLAKLCSDGRDIALQIQNTVQAVRRPSGPALQQFKGACDGVSDHDLASKYQNLKFAVSAHLPAAAYEFYQAGFNGDISAANQRPDDPLVIEWKQQVASELLRAADAGDLNAMSVLYRLYDGADAGLVEKDPVKSLTYFIARSTLLAQEGQPMSPDFIARREARYTPEQIATAKAGARAITAAFVK